MNKYLMLFCMPTLYTLYSGSHRGFSGPTMEGLRTLRVGVVSSQVTKGREAFLPLCTGGFREERLGVLFL